MTNINLESYFKSLDKDNSFAGIVASEQINTLQEHHKEIELLSKNDEFYAKGFFDTLLTDKFYLFNESRIKILTFVTTEEKRITGVTIDEYKYSEIKKNEIYLSIGSEPEVVMELVFEDGNQVIFNNIKDSKGFWVNSLGKQIKKIYKLITNK